MISISKYVVAFLIFVLFLPSCDSLNRRDICECVDLTTIFTDQMLLSKEEKQQKEAGCAWVEQELSPFEILEAMAECNSTNSPDVNDQE